MTRQRIAEGLELLALALPEGHGTPVPPGWEPHEWIYVKGLAFGAIMRVRCELAALP